MQVFYTSSFKKRFAKLPAKIQQKFSSRLELFMSDPINRLLENHPLKGNLLGLRSFSITGDYRVVFIALDKDSVKLIDIGKHSQVYS